MHPKVMLTSRYVTFHKSLVVSSKLGVRVLARLCALDRRTVMGRTLETLCLECGVSDPTMLAAKLVKSKLKYQTVPVEEEWKIHLSAELLKLRDQKLSIPGFTMDEIKDMFVFSCIS